MNLKIKREFKKSGYSTKKVSVFFHIIQLIGIEKD